MIPGGRPRLLLLLLAVAAAAAYGRTLSHGFAYDDLRFVEGNAGLDGVAAAPWRALDPRTTTADGAEPGMWRPLRTLSFALDRLLFGAGPAGPHLANLLLHGAATGLVFALGMGLGLDDLAAAAGAAVFAFHPVQVESVAWISSRGDLLAASLALGAAALHLRRVPAFWPAALCALAMLGKESAAAAPLLLPVADFAAGGAARVRDRWRAAAAAAGAVAAVVAARSLALAATGTPSGQWEGADRPSISFVASALPSVFGWYGLRVLGPSPGTFDLQIAPSALLALAFLGGVALLVLAPRLGLPAGAARGLRAAGLWAAAALLPVTLLQLLVPLKILAADRFLYLALAGPALAAGAAARWAGEGTARGALALSPLLLLAAFPAMDRWRSDEALWRDTLERVPGHPRALVNLAMDCVDRPEEARGYLRAAVDQGCPDVGAWLSLGLLEEDLFLRERDPASRRRLGESAAATLAGAIRIWEGGNPDRRDAGLPQARLARACVLQALGEDEEAAAEAGAGAALLAEAPPEVRGRTASRVEFLRGWALRTGRGPLAERLEAIR